MNRYFLLPDIEKISWIHLSNVIPIPDRRFTYSATLQVGKHEWKSVIVKTAAREIVDMNSMKQYCENIKMEASLIHSLACHPGLVRLEGHGFVSNDEHSQLNDYFFVLQHATTRGGTLEGLLSMLNTSTRSHAIGLLQLIILRELADVLGILHSESVIHRDVRPANMAFTKEGTFYITDLSLAIQSNGVPTTGVVGSVRYMAPEVALGQPYGRPADVYSFALVAYEITHGIKPFKGVGIDAHRELVCAGRIRPDIISKSLPQLNRIGRSSTNENPVGELIEACWDHDPRRRPPMLKVVEEIDEFLSELSPAHAGYSTEARAARSKAISEVIHSAAATMFAKCDQSGVCSIS